MILDGTHKAILDRFEETQGNRVAVLVVEGEERPLGDLLVEPGELLEAARHQDTILEVTIADGELREATYEERETGDRQESAQSRFDRLSKRSPMMRTPDHALQIVHRPSLGTRRARS